MIKRFFLLIVFLIFIVSSITFLLILLYLDPFKDVILSSLLLWFSFVLSFTSFFAFFLYIFKKIYYRGEVFIGHIFSSLRQSFLWSLFIVGLVVFYNLWVFEYSTIALLFFIILFIELLLKNFD